MKKNKKDSRMKSLLEALWWKSIISKDELDKILFNPGNWTEGFISIHCYRNCSYEPPFVDNGSDLYVSEGISGRLITEKNSSDIINWYLQQNLISSYASKLGFEVTCDSSDTALYENKGETIYIGLPGTPVHSAWSNACLIADAVSNKFDKDNPLPEKSDTENMETSKEKYSIKTGKDLAEFFKKRTEKPETPDEVKPKEKDELEPWEETWEEDEAVSRKAYDYQNRRGSFRIKEDPSPKEGDDTVPVESKENPFFGFDVEGALSELEKDCAYADKEDNELLAKYPKLTEKLETLYGISLDFETERIVNSYSKEYKAPKYIVRKIIGIIKKKIKQQSKGE